VKPPEGVNRLTWQTACDMNEKPASNRDRRPCLTELVRRSCKGYELQHYHTHDSRHSQKGFPDFVIALKTGPIYVELKKQTTRPSPEQVFWLNYFSRHGHRCFLWRPLHWLNGTVDWVLGHLGQVAIMGNPIHAGAEHGLWSPGLGVVGDKFSLPVRGKI
jgi:hypothetical protein